MVRMVAISFVLASGEDVFMQEKPSSMDYKSFDYGTVNVACDEWYGTLSGGGHTQSECLSFCQNDRRCFYATYYAASGYCHTSAGTCKYIASTRDNPITYHRTMHNMNDFAAAAHRAEVASVIGGSVDCPTCTTTTKTAPCSTTTTTTAATTTTTSTTTTVATTTTTTAAILPTAALFAAYNGRMKDSCTGISSTACHDGTVEKQGHRVGYALKNPISGFTDEIFKAYSSRMKDSCTGTASVACHDGSVKSMGSSIGFILKNPIPSKTTPMYKAYSSRMKDSCTGDAGTECHDGTVKSMGQLLGHMLTSQDVTLDDIKRSFTAVV